MAITHLFFNQNSQHGNMLRSTMAQLEGGLIQLNEVLGAMNLMLTGDGSLTTHFPYMTAKFGFTDDATSQAAWQELTALAAKLNVDTSVTNVHAQLIQGFNKFR